MVHFLQVSIPKPSIDISYHTYDLYASSVPSSLIVITLIIPCEQYRPLSFSLRSHFSPCHLEPLGPNFPLSTPFSNTPHYVLLPLQHNKYRLSSPFSNTTTYVFLPLQHNKYPPQHTTLKQPTLCPSPTATHQISPSAHHTTNTPPYAFSHCSTPNIPLSTLFSNTSTYVLLPLQHNKYRPQHTFLKHPTLFLSPHCSTQNIPLSTPYSNTPTYVPLPLQHNKYPPQHTILKHPTLCPPPTATHQISPSARYSQTPHPMSFSHCSTPNIPLSTPFSITPPYVFPHTAAH